MTDGLRLERLARVHAERLERFEQVNRTFFASHIADRGDDFFDHFTDRLAAQIADDEAGACRSYVLVDQTNEIVGRVNLFHLDEPESTELGFRVAEHVQGRGVATTGVTMALDEAAAEGVRVVRARASVSNVASQRVLERCGFTETGPTDPPAGSSKSFVGFVRWL